MSLWLTKQSMNWKWKCAQSCLTLCDLMDFTLPGSSVHGIFQATVLEWFAISFSRGSSRPRNRTQVSLIVDRHFTTWDWGPSIIWRPTSGLDLSHSLLSLLTLVPSLECLPSQFLSVQTLPSFKLHLKVGLAKWQTPRLRIQKNLVLNICSVTFTGCGLEHVFYTI